MRSVPLLLASRANAAVSVSPVKLPHQHRILHRVHGGRVDPGLARLGADAGLILGVLVRVHFRRALQRQGAPVAAQHVAVLRR
jgi:hypothetical protein